MNGIERITEKIVSDAKAEAQALLDAAYAEFDDTISSANARAGAVAAAYGERLEKQRADAAARADSAGDLEKRNASLAARANLVERAFNEAHKRVLELPENEYYAFLETLLAKTAKERAAEDLSHESGNDEYDEFDKYELLMNEKDRTAFGERLVGSLSGKIGKKELVLSEETVEIDGGFILKWSRVDLNCSVSQLIRAARDRLEREVCAILYPQKDNED